jgi:hypothetical protein
VLKIYPLKTLLLEEKEEEQVFEEYDPESIEVKVNFWRLGMESLTEDGLKPEHIKVKKNLTI